MTLRKWLAAAGIALVAVSLGLFCFGSVREKKSIADNNSAVSFISSLLPEPSPGLKEERATYRMPSLCYDGRDYCALLEIPRFNVTLPVAASWNKSETASQPCRYAGSTYEGSLIVGGTDAPGQLDCIAKIDVGDRITVTDMNGRVYGYTVKSVRHAKNARKATLLDGEWDFTLFAKDSRSGDTLLVRCAAES